MNGFEDHGWRVRTWDEDSTVFGHLQCLECRVHYGAGANAGKGKFVKNLFNNFKFKHIKTDKHYSSYLLKRGIASQDTTKQDVITSVVLDHAAEIAKGEEIVKRLNDVYDGPKPPFTVTFPQTLGVIKAFLYKVRCTYCSHSFELVPRMKNLEHNLLTHLGSQKHLEAAQVKNPTNEPFAVSSGKRGRPRGSDSRDKSKDEYALLRFFKADASKTSSSSSSKGKQRLT